MLRENKGVILWFAIILLAIFLLSCSPKPVDTTVVDTAAGPLQGATCFNGTTCERNLQDLIKSSTNDYNTVPRWNTTQVWSGGECANTDGVGCLWVPKFQSSSRCNMTSDSLSTYGSAACQSSSMVDNDTSVQVTDELSEVGSVLCAGNASVEPLVVSFMNNLESVSAACSTNGDLQGWVQCRNATDIQCPDGNDASDAVHRNVVALYTCAANGNFSVGNRTRALNLASKYMNQSITHDTEGTTSKATVNYGTLSWWLFAGGSQAAFSGAPEEDQYGGYYGDSLLACVAHAKQNPSNTTLRAICGNWTAQFLAMSEYSGGTSGTNFRTPYVRIWFNESVGIVRPGPPSGFSSYYNGANGRCDDADCPRFANICHALDMANKTGQYDLTTAPWKNLTDYCTAFGNNNGWNAGSSDAQSCQSYNGSGVCVTGPYDSVFLVGTQAPSLTWTNRSQFVNATSELNRHWSWNTMSITDGGVTCGSGLTYSHVRWPKVLAIANGVGESIYTSQITMTGGGSGPNITITNPRVNATNVTYGGAVRFNVTIATTQGDITNAKVQVLFANGTRANYTLTRLTQ